MLLSEALAQPSASAPLGANVGEPSPLMGVAPFLLIVVVFYFLLIRPQQKKLKSHDAMIKALRRGDKIVTAGGVIGVIHKIEGDDVLVIEVAPETRVRIVRDTVSAVLAKTVANENAGEQ